MRISSRKCREKGCKLTGVWSETDADGKTLVCLRTRHRGAIHEQKFTFAELIEVTDAPLEEIEVFLVERRENGNLG